MTISQPKPYSIHMYLDLLHNTKTVENELPQYHEQSEITLLIKHNMMHQTLCRQKTVKTKSATLYAGSTSLVKGFHA